MADERERMGVGTYLTPEEAQEFHKLFVAGFTVFTIIAIIAHILVWNWRSWLPPEGGYGSASVAQTQQLAAAPANPAPAS